MSDVLHPSVRSWRLKICVFILVGISAMATTFFLYDLYFYTTKRFGFHAVNNLRLAATMGFIYCGSSLLAGKFAQRFGYFFCIRFGIGVMVTAMLAASQVDGVWPTLALVMIANFGVCFLWPPMEALMSEGEPPSRLQGLVGLYSCSWAGCSALAYFSGGAILDHYDLRSIFFVPSGIFVGLLFFLFWFERQVKRQPPLATVDQHPLLHAVGGDSASPIAPATFLKMAWLANPMAYLLINTVVSTIPSLAQRYHFNSTQAGFACSAWLFARAASFFLLRLWPNWHYRFRFLAIGYGAMVISFAAMLIVQNLVVLIISQLVLGLTVGLMYYSSLFYSMDVGETKGEHGGIHESAIGLGSGTGPAVAALALWVFPNHSASGAIGVCGILLVGFATLMWMRFQRPAKPKSRF